MINYYPDSMLLNNIYIPTYVQPKKIVLNCLDNLSIETGLNGLQSTINLANNNQNISPYLDLSRYDPETKDWFWYDEEGFPLRIIRHLDGTKWCLSPIYNISKHYGSLLTFDPFSLEYNAQGQNLGFYSKVTEIDNSSDIPEIKVYNGRPIILNLASKITTDLTDYSTFNNDVVLTDYNIDSNREFFYNLQLNKLYTNQNLTSYDLSKVEVYCFVTTNSVKVKCLLSGNSGMNNFATPAIDYYIAKLHGQYLKG